MVGTITQKLNSHLIMTNSTCPEMYNDRSKIMREKFEVSMMSESSFFPSPYIILLKESILINLSILYMYKILSLEKS